MSSTKKLSPAQKEATYYLNGGDGGRSPRSERSNTSSGPPTEELEAQIKAAFILHYKTKNYTLEQTRNALAEDPYCFHYSYGSTSNGNPDEVSLTPPSESWYKVKRKEWGVRKNRTKSDYEAAAAQRRCEEDGRFSEQPYYTQDKIAITGSQLSRHQKRRAQEIAAGSSRCPVPPSSTNLSSAQRTVKTDDAQHGRQNASTRDYESASPSQALPFKVNNNQILGPLFDPLEVVERDLALLHTSSQANTTATFSPDITAKRNLLVASENLLRSRSLMLIAGEDALFEDGINAFRSIIDKSTIDRHRAVHLIGHQLGTGAKDPSVVIDLLGEAMCNLHCWEQTELSDIHKFSDKIERLEILLRRRAVALFKAAEWLRDKTTDGSANNPADHPWLRIQRLYCGTVCGTVPAEQTDIHELPTGSGILPDRMAPLRLTFWQTAWCSIDGVRPEYIDRRKRMPGAREVDAPMMQCFSREESSHLEFRQARSASSHDEPRRAIEGIDRVL